MSDEEPVFFPDPKLEWWLGDDKEIVFEPAKKTYKPDPKPTPKKKPKKGRK